MAAERNITIVQGDTYVHEIRLRSNANAVINVSSSTFSGQIRKSGVSDVVIASFSINTSNSSNGNIIFTLSSGVTGNIKKGIVSGVHTPTFDIDEDAIKIGISMMAYLGARG